MKVEIYGLQRSGTNYLEWILDKCFGLDVQYGIRKHDFPEERGITDFSNKIVIYKDFDHWVESIKRDPSDLWFARGHDVNLREFYDKFNSEWSAKIPSVRYEDFLLDYEGSLDNLSRIFNTPVLNYNKPVPGSLHRSQGFRQEHFSRYI